jgi:hypothetical protein
MYNSFMIFLLVLTETFPNLNNGGTIPASKSLQVALYSQQTDMWCWAASGQMCMSFLGATVDISQCTEATKEFGRNDCCNTPTPNNCVNGGWPEFEKFGFAASVTNYMALSWSQLTAQIDSQKPVAFSWAWTGGGGHMMVATGYSLAGNDSLVHINDPWEPNVGKQYWISYSDYVSGSDHTHWNDFYSITKQ